MNSKNTLWMFLSFLLTFTLLMTACAPGALETAAPEESPAPAETEEPAEPPAATEEPAPEGNFPPPIEGEFECTAGDNIVCIAGGNEDVQVIIPMQEAYGAFLYAVNLPTMNLEDLRSDNVEFKPYRLVINFELVLDPDVPEEYISEFGPPIELGVRYTAEDLNAVGGVENLQLGFWDEKNGKWVSFTNGNYEYRIDGTEEGGYFWVTISNWGDRHIGFG